MTGEARIQQSAGFVYRKGREGRNELDLQIYFRSVACFAPVAVICRGPNPDQVTPIAFRLCPIAFPVLALTIAALCEHFSQS